VINLQSRNFSHKAASLKSFMAMDILERAQELEREGRSIIHLAVGEPDFPTPGVIKEAAVKALEADQTHYTHSLGTFELRQTIADYYLKRYHVKISPEQILVTSGTSPALMLACAVLHNPGDKVIVSDPGYACYSNFVTYCDGTPQLIKVYEDNGFQFEPQTLKKNISPQTKAILINSPANPTGNLLEADRMRELAALGLPILSDEIYHGLVYEGEEHSILEYTDNAFVFNGFSKLYAMTGWRLGYLIAPPRYMRTLQTLQQNSLVKIQSNEQTFTSVGKRLIPKENNSSAFFGVIPNPPDAFSQFAIIISGEYSFLIKGKKSLTAFLPEFATMSPK
jgi:aspartate/methionine/tyrosine aminotransferase